MKNRRYFIIILLCLILTAIAGCHAITGDQDSIITDNQLSEQDLFKLSPDFFHKTCLDVLGESTYVYHDRGIDAPDYASTRLSIFTVITTAHSRNIKRIDIQFQFDDGDKIHSQSVVIWDGKVSSYISSSPKPISHDADIHTISLSAFIKAVEDFDFAQFTEISGDADQYTIDFEGVSDIFYHNTGNVVRYLANTDGMMDGNRQDNIQLDRYVPVVLFCAYIESEPGHFSGENAVQLYINK